MSAYSSFLHFHLFSAELSQGMATAVSFFCFYLYLYHDEEKFAVISAVGTYISPIMLAGNGELYFHAGFFLIWAIIFSFISISLKSRTLPMLASYMGIGIFTALYQGTNDPDELRIIVLVLAAQFFAFTGGTYFYSIKHKNALSKAEALSFLPVLLFFYGAEYYFLNKLSPDLAPWISIGFAVFLFLLYTAAKKQLRLIHSKDLIQNFISVVLFHSGYIVLMPEEGKTWLLPMILFGNYIASKREEAPVISGALRLMFATIGLIEFLKTCFKLITENNLLTVVPAIITILLGFFYYMQGTRFVKNTAVLFLSVIHLMVILTLYRIVFDYGSLSVSVVWGVYALIILLWGYNIRDAILAKSSLLILVAASLKALLYDASMAPSSVRIFSLIVTGAVLYGAGYIFQKINRWA